MTQCCICQEDYLFSRQFHTFPRNTERREQWFRSIGYTVNAYENKRICSDHFTEDDYYICDIRFDQNPSKRLKKTAIPSVFTPRSEKKYIQHEISVDVQHTVPTTSTFDIIRPRKQSNKREKMFIKIGKYTTQCLRRTEFVTNRSWMKFAKSLNYYKYLNNLLLRQNKRLKNNNIILKSQLQLLESKNLVKNNNIDALKGVLPRSIYDLLTRILNNKKTAKFSHSLRCFAATLHFHSPAAYLFVRKAVLKCLPHPKTLRMWMQNIDSSSGISKQALNIISDVVQNAREKENKKIVFNLTLDEMSIRKRIDWDGQKSHGYIDIGTRSVHGDVPLASEVLVFMLVAINDKFKLPIAYYFTDKLNGLEKAKLLKTALCALYEKNIDVVSITFDGATSNISMCQELGAHLKSTDIENIVPHFAHPANECKRIIIFYDACHMIKLVRNTIATYDLTDNDDRTISWNYIKQLVFLQTEEKLHPAVKVRNRHIYFKNEKMKVSLAVQVLSTSVCDALQFLEHDLKLPHFAAASETAIFCKMLNDI